MRRRSFLLGAVGALYGKPAPGGLGTLAYVQHDGLWIRELPDGRPRRLVSGAAIESPRFSPTGKWLVYFGRDVLHVIPAAGGASVSLGKPDRGTVSAGCQWSPSGEELLVGASDAVRFFRADNGWRRAVRKIQGASLPVAFHPSGSELVYGDALVSGRGPGGEPMRTGRLCRVAPGSSGKPMVLGFEYLSGKIPFAWTLTGDILYWEDPDFSSSAIADGLELFRIPASGGPPRSLRFSTLVREDMLAFSPGRERLAACTGGGRNAWEKKRIVVVDLATWAVSDVTAKSMASVCPAWSPDGSAIAFSAAPDPGSGIGGGEEARRLLAQRRIWVVAARGGSAPQALTGDSRYRDEAPRWSPDGRRILFCRLSADDRKTLWLMGADGSNATQVAELFSADDWFGYYGYLEWTTTFDWLRGS